MAIKLGIVIPHILFSFEFSNSVAFLVQGEVQ